MPSKIARNHFSKKVPLSSPIFLPISWIFESNVRVKEAQNTAIAVIGKVTTTINQFCWSKNETKIKLLLPTGSH
ncbi:MAG: hypothetical protein ACK552_05825 [Microcystis sp.]